MTNEQGNLAINSENIFPIIKKWLYSDHDIFIREVVSNACDAITKLKKLDLMSEASLPDDYKAKIEVEVNPEDKTITFTDNGLGMTADEVKEYINQIAFSGAADFLEKYKDKTVEKRIKVSRNLDYIIRTENIDCGKLLEKAVKDYLALKY